MSAKIISKIAKGVCGLGVLICGILYFKGVLPTATVRDIVVLWAGAYAISAGTIDLNIIFDKFLGGKNG